MVGSGLVDKLQDITWGVQDRNRSLKVRPPVLEEWVIEEVITDINYSHI